MKKQNPIDIIIVFIQVLLSIVLLFMIKKLLPLKYLAVIALLLAILALIIILFLLVKQKAKWFNRILSIIISICLLLVNFTAYKGLDTLKEITGSKEEIYTYSIIVLDDSEYQYIEDLDGLPVGKCSKVNQSQYDEVIYNINITTQIEEVDYDSVIEMQQALFDGDVEAIILNEAYREAIEEVNETFSDDTRIIDSHDITTYVNIGSHTVNVTKDAFSLFISGIDTYGPVSTVSRSDVNMIVTVNPKTKTILLTSIPRDYYVTLATSGQKDKLTHAGIYGVNESVETLENLFDIDISYYARVNFTSLTTMVDALGGITIYNPTEFRINGHAFAVGNINLTGEDALYYSRARYQLSGGDRDRIQNQQRVLQGMLEKAMSPAIISNYSSILEAITGCFETNMTSDEIQSLIQMQLNDMSSWHFKTQVVDGTGTTSTTCYSMPGSELYVMEPDQDTIDQARQSINNILGING